MIHIHRWTKWSPVTLFVRPNIAGFGEPPIYDKEYKVDGQERTCTKCGKIKKKMVSR